MNRSSKIIITKLNIGGKELLFSGLTEDDCLLEIRLESLSILEGAETGEASVIQSSSEKACGSKNETGRKSRRFPDGSELLGGIYVGRVQKVVKNINAAFVEIAPGLACYYPLDQNRDPVFAKKLPSLRLVQGDELLVQVQREAVKMKAPTVSSNLNLTGRYAVLTTENRRIGVSGKLPRNQKEHYKSLLKDFLEASVYAIGGKTETAKTENVVMKETTTSKKAETPVSFVSKEETCGFPYGIIVRTNAVNTSDEELLREIAALKVRMDDLISHAPTRTCFSRLYAPEPKFLQYLLNSRGDQADEIVTDIPAVYDELRERCGQYDDLRDIPLRFYDAPTYPLAKLYNLSRQTEHALAKTVWLKSGGFLVIEPTEALTVIDVNTGKSVSKKDVQRHFLETNLEAAAEIAAQLRLRNLSGIIVVDFIDLARKEDEELLLKELRARVKPDPVPVCVHDMTELGLVELTRKKVEKPLAGQLRELT